MTCFFSSPQIEHICSSLAKNQKTMRKTTKAAVKQAAKIILGSALWISIPMLGITISHELQVGNNDVCIPTDSIETTSAEDLIDSVRNELISEVENYVFKTFPSTHKTVPSSIVINGLNHEVDIAFMMAQTQIETAFGTTGAGRSTSRRSLFGVAIKRYESYEHAVQDYLRILKKFYLTKGRTEQHLMNNYTTSGGARYAESTSYEKNLKGAYGNIIKNTNVKSLQGKYQKLILEKNSKEL